MMILMVHAMQGEMGACLYFPRSMFPQVYITLILNLTPGLCSSRYVVPQVYVTIILNLTLGLYVTPGLWSSQVYVTLTPGLYHPRSMVPSAIFPQVYVTLRAASHLSDTTAIPPLS